MSASNIVYNSAFRLRAASALAVTVMLVSVGCVSRGSPDPSGGQHDPATATLDFPLLQNGPHGELYGLQNAIFNVTDTNGNQQRVFTGTGQTSVAISVPPGLVTIELLDGWTLSKSTDGGITFQPVSAKLASLNPQTLRALANVPVIVSFDFIIRDTTGTVRLTLGVVASPHELVGAYIVETATGDLAPYSDLANRRLDFAFYFGVASIEDRVLADGTHQRLYTAAGPDPASPNEPDGVPVAADFFNDKLGMLSGSIADELGGGTLQYAVGVRPDRSIELSGVLTGGFTTITFGPDVIDDDSLTIGADGFANDVFFYASAVRFTQTSDQGDLTGIMRVRRTIPVP